MGVLNRLKINGKLFILTGMAFLFLLFIIIYSIFNFASQNNHLKILINERLKNSNSARILLENTQEIHIKLFEMITWKNALYETNVINSLIVEVKNEIGSNNAYIDFVLTNSRMEKEEKETFQSIRKQIADYGEWCNNTIDILLYDINIATFYMGTANDKFVLLKKSLKNLNDYESRFIGKSYSENQSNYRVNQLLFIIVIVVSSILLFFLSFAVRNSITKPLFRLVDAIKLIAEGDFTKKIELNSGDEIGTVGSSVNWLTSKLNEDIGEVERVAGNVNSVAESSDSTIKSGLKNMETIKEQLRLLDERTEKSIKNIEMLTSTVEEMVRNVESIMSNIESQTSSVEEEAGSIEEMNRNIENTVKASNQSQDISSSLNRMANEGNEAIQQTLNAIKEVGSFTRQIDEMLKFITEIAEQTNMLSMNASIEAAHAGESGKGFTIVASEIRVLSENTNNKAKEIESIATAILKKIGETVELSNKAQKGLQLISEYSVQNDTVAKNLNIAMNEQQNGAREILISTQELVKITEEVKNSMNEQKKATESFSKSISDFKNLSVENKDFTLNHIRLLNDLLAIQENISSQVSENKKQSEILNALVRHFKVTSKS